MKKFLSLFIAMVIIALICTSLLWLTGTMTPDEAATIGVSAAVAGVLAPIIVAAGSKWLRRNE